MKKAAVAMIVVLILLLIPSGFINLRRGVHMGDRFYMPHDNGDNSWTYRAEPGYEVTLDWCGTGTGCGVMTDWSEQSVQLDWTDDWARFEFEDGTVLEGQWTGEALIDAEGKPLWMNDDEEESIIQIVVGDETDKGLRKYTIACALCKMDRRELVSFGSVWIMLLGAAIYGFGMLYAVTTAFDGGQGLQKFRAIKPDLVLLDVMMPVMDGWGVCKTIRAEAQTPIIMLTAKGETDDKVTGLRSGADDYVTKPFEMKEVLARIEAVLRRTSGAAAEKKARRLVFDQLVIDMDAFELLVDGKKIDTPPKEMELLYYLASSPNRVYTRNQLLDEVWGFDYFGDSRTVDVHVKRLREKLETVTANWSLKTVWGVGYKFEVL